MKRAQQQRSLADIWREGSQKKKSPSIPVTNSDENVSEPSASGGPVSSDETDDDDTCEMEQDSDSSHQTDPGFCRGMCCGDEMKAYQPHEKATLSLFVRNDRRFLPSWYSKHPWITLCCTQKKVFCMYCRYAHKHKLLTFSKRGEDAFSVTGFDTYKKALEKFRIHENSDSHQEAKLKWAALKNPSIQEQLSSQIAQAQANRRSGLLKQLEVLRFLLRQGIALRGHDEEEGNLLQLLLLWSKESTVLKEWLRERKYLSHTIVNELMGQSVLRQVLAEIKGYRPNWFSIIADEATDVNFREQLNVSVRYVTDDYEVNEKCLPT